MNISEQISRAKAEMLGAQNRLFDNLMNVINSKTDAMRLADPSEGFYKDPPIRIILFENSTHRFHTELFREGAEEPFGITVTSFRKVGKADLHPVSQHNVIVQKPSGKKPLGEIKFGAVGKEPVLLRGLSAVPAIEGFIASLL